MLATVRCAMDCYDLTSFRSFATDQLLSNNNPSRCLFDAIEDRCDAWVEEQGQGAK